MVDLLPTNHGRNLVIVCTVILAVAGRWVVAAEPQRTSLDTYVAQPDDSFRWTLRREGKVGSTEYVELTLVSQTWHNITWKHQLFVLRPASLVQDGRHALLFIGGGSWTEELEQVSSEERLPREAERFAALAEQIQTPIAVLLHVPHQPILGGKHEDELIAYTFQQFLLTGDGRWPLLLPMVKSAVRAMDAVQAAAAQQWSLEIASFTVTGASKRGWTTWLTAAVDPRVEALAPMVIDMLNMSAQMKHQMATWGDFSYKIDDYTRLGLQRHLATPAGARLREIVDPYSYRQRLKQPKLIILGTNDHYWPLDAANMYWEELEDPKHLLYIPNNGHDLNDLPRLIGTLAAFHRHTIEDQTLPQVSWNFEMRDRQLVLHLKADERPESVRAWMAHSPTRDFREARWKVVAAEADEQEPGSYVGVVDIPASGLVAMFGEFTFAGEQTPFYLSTNVQIRGQQEMGSQ